MSEQERKQIQDKITQLKEQLKDVKGAPCQVYSRVVGYLRPVQSWNDGKVEEYKSRKFYNAGNGEKEKELANTLHEETMSQMKHIKCFRGCR